MSSKPKALPISVILERGEISGQISMEIENFLWGRS